MLFIYKINEDYLLEEIMCELVGSHPLISDNELNLISTESMVESLENLKLQLPNLNYSELKVDYSFNEKLS